MEPYQWSRNEVKVMNFKKLVKNIDANILNAELGRISQFLRNDDAELSFPDLSLVGQEILWRILKCQFLLYHMNGLCKERAINITEVLNKNRHVYEITPLQQSDLLIYRKKFLTYNEEDLMIPFDKKPIKIKMADDFSNESTLEMEQGRLATPLFMDSQTINKAATFKNEGKTSTKKENGGLSVNLSNKSGNNMNILSNENILENKQRRIVVETRNVPIDNEIRVKGLSIERTVMFNKPETNEKNLSVISGKKPPQATRTSRADQPTIRMKTIEALKKPIEIDKSIRMMNLMGWTGGALGMREDGITEPIMPSLDLVRRAGLGHVKKEKPESKCTRRTVSLPRMSAAMSRIVDVNSDNKTNQRIPITEPKPTPKSNQDPPKRVPTLFRQDFLTNFLKLITGDEATRIITYPTQLVKKEKMFITNALKSFNSRKKLHLTSCDEMSIACEIISMMAQSKDLIVTCTAQRCEIELKKTVTKIINKAEVKRLKKLCNTSGATDKLDIRIPEDMDVLLASVNSTVMSKKSNDSMKFRLHYLLQVLNFLKQPESVLTLHYNFVLNTKQVRNLTLFTESINNRMRVGPTKLEALVSGEVLRYVGNNHLHMDLNSGLTSLTLTKIICRKVRKSIGFISGNTEPDMNDPQESAKQNTLKPQNSEPQTNIFTQNFTNIQENNINNNNLFVNDNTINRTPSIFTQNIYNIQQNNVVIQNNTNSDNCMETQPYSDDTSAILDSKFNDSDVSMLDIFTDDTSDEIEVQFVTDDNYFVISDDDDEKNNGGFENGVKEVEESKNGDENAVEYSNYVNNISDNKENNKNLGDNTDKNVNKVVGRDNGNINNDVKDINTKVSTDNIIKKYIDEDEYNKIDLSEIVNTYEVKLDDANNSDENNSPTDNLSTDETDSIKNKDNLDLNNSFDSNINIEPIKTEKKIFDTNKNELKEKLLESKINNKDNLVLSNSDDSNINEEPIKTEGKLVIVNEKVLDTIKNELGETILESNNNKDNLVLNKPIKTEKELVISNEKLLESNTNELEEKIPESNVNNKVFNENIICIASKDYPKPLSDSQVNEVQLIISTNIQIMKIFPLLKCHGVQNGFLIYSCHNDESRDFLKKVLCVACSVKIVEKIIDTLELKIQCFFDFEVSYLYNMIEVYNKGISTKEWNIREIDASSDCIALIIKMDEASIDFILNANFSLYAGIDKIQFSIYLT